MKIEYNKKDSKFFEPCKKFIQNYQNQILSKEQVSINLGGSGYEGTVVIDINENNSTFNTDWVNSDPSRFPARIKACATMLYRMNFIGRYKISHYNGKLSITLEEQE